MDCCSFFVMVVVVLVVVVIAVLLVVVVLHAPRCSRSINAIHSLKWSTNKRKWKQTGMLRRKREKRKKRGERREQRTEGEQEKERGKGYSNWQTESKASADSKTGVTASPLWAPRAPYRVSKLQQQMLPQSGEFCERRWQLECGINAKSLKWRQ